MRTPGGHDTVITIDAPAGAGKSVVAAALAQRLGFTLVDTGALYRGLAWAMREAGMPIEDGPAQIRGVEIFVGNRAPQG